MSSDNASNVAIELLNMSLQAVGKSRSGCKRSILGKRFRKSLQVKKREEDAPAGDDSEIVVQFKYKYETSTNKSEQVQILAILPQRLSGRDENSLGHQIT
jgi:hypothetical protein